MTNYKLNPKETLIHQEKSNPKLKAKAKHQYALYLGAFLLIVGALFIIPAKNDSIMYAPALISAGVGVIFIIFYFVKMKEVEEETYTYIITSARVLKLNSQDQEVQSIAKGRIRSVDIDEIKGSAGDVVINKREVNEAEQRKRELRGEIGPFYSNDTIVLNDIENAAEFADKI